VIAGPPRPISVRRLASEEWAVLRVLRLAMLYESPLAYDTSRDAAEATDEDGWRKWLHRGEDGGRSVWAAFGPEPVGMVAAESDGQVCHIGAVWTAPSWRGLGAVGLLLDAAEMWAWETRCAVCVLGVAEENPARMLYERRGYVATGKRHRTRHGTMEVELEKPAGTPSTPRG
jgi:GNAT superfamily N-acetyltransferase